MKNIFEGIGFIMIGILFLYLTIKPHSNRTIENITKSKIGGWIIFYGTIIFILAGVLLLLKDYLPFHSYP